MLRNHILEYLITYIKEQFKIEDEISEETNIQQIGLDSLDIVNLLFNIEEKYGVNIPDEDLTGKDLFVLCKMVDYIFSQKKIAENKA